MRRSTVTSGVDNALTGAGGQRADLVGNPYFSGDRNHQAMISQYLNTTAFAANAIGTYGTLGRNTFIGPGFANLDLGVVKDFAPQERFKAQLRFEMFNSLNHANFSNPGGFADQRNVHADYQRERSAHSSDRSALRILTACRGQSVGSGSIRLDNHEINPPA